MRRRERKIEDPGIIESIFARADVCRIAFADNDTPYIVAMNFGYQVGETNILYFHCAPEGRKMDMMRKNSNVCFQVDTDHVLYKGLKACGWGMRYKSIVGYGFLSVTTDPAEREKALDLLMEHYGARGEHDYDDKELARTVILKLQITEMTGKQA